MDHSIELERGNSVWSPLLEKENEGEVKHVIERIEEI
jgi:hypothetical protein